ncbi:hypothetical protein EW145_g1756 [Phellinidium pouzarii]|uniref:Uncharacterized protein n=1 Tax=Phellinidium pouzarii TaxID=167371 RepID=A0A4S4LDJ7_9AGAM|nr:hypothetical protein EW145_g1756 [Phellinidium pouzarii]
MKPCILYGIESHQSFGPYLIHLDLRDYEEKIFLTMQNVSDIMSEYYNLRHLAIRLGFPTDALHDTRTMEHLKTLRLSWQENVDPGSLFDILQAPLLENIELDGVLPLVDSIPGQWNHLQRFLAHSAPPLRSLDLYKLRCADIDLVSCLADCALLERLWMEECTVDESIVRCLTDDHHPLVTKARDVLGSLRPRTRKMRNF